MNEKEIRMQMARLWIKTFGDSQEYVDLLFDNYFDLNLIEYYEEKGIIIASLLGIPYEFKNGFQTLKGLYLCGLCTETAFRKQGIMSYLLDKINNRVKEKFDISFLIPATEELQIFYQARDYHKGIYRVEEKYTNAHNFDNDFLYENNREEERIRKLKNNFYKNLKVDILKANDEKEKIKVIEFIEKEEKEHKSCLILQHGTKNLKVVLAENEIDNGKIFICKTPDNIVTGVGFINSIENGRIMIPALFYSDKASYYKLLQSIHNQFPEYSISLFVEPGTRLTPSIKKEIYISENPKGSELESIPDSYENISTRYEKAQVYGLVKPLNIEKILSVLAEMRKDISFDVYLKEKRDSEDYLFCEIRNGEARFKKIDKQDFKNKEKKTKYPSTELTYKEMATILFRKKENNDIIMEALGIPSLSLYMNLMLD